MIIKVDEKDAQFLEAMASMSKAYTVESNDQPTNRKASKEEVAADMLRVQIKMAETKLKECGVYRRNG